MYLRQATASQSREVGPFIDDTDFKTVKTGLTIANTDVKLSANGAAGASKNSGGGTHRNNGMYALTFDATDTATVGELAGSVVVSSALPVAFKFFVLEEATYDALFAASAAGFDGNQRVSVGGFAAGAITAAAIASAALTAAKFAADTGLVPVRSATAQAGASTTITLDASASAVDQFYLNDLVCLVSGTGAGQARFITGYVGSTKVATVGTWVTNPDNTSVFAILPSDATAAPNTAQIATAVWTDLLAGSDFSTVASIGKLLKDDIDAAISSRMATYTQPTGFLAATFPGTVASPTNITAGTITNVTNAPTSGDFTAAMKTSIGTAVAASAVASVTGAVGSIGTGGIAASSFAANAIDAAAIATTGANEIADALLDRADAIETGYTPRKALRLTAAAVAGKLSGAATTTVTIRSLDDSADRLTATVDVNGNRTAVTLTP